MCGIVGIFNPFELPNRFKDKDRVKSMTISVHHRGPDEKGLLTSKIAYLGHARLSIVDLETGSQPMVSADKDVAVVLNGEIFNYIELREELKKKNLRFRTSSDTEVLLELYREYGPEMLGKLNGQFAFAIVDFVKKKLFLARDRVGIRPLYYTFVDDTIIFASAIKAITLNPEVDRKFRYSAFQQLTGLWTTYGKTTFLEGIYSILPGEFVEYDQKGLKERVYWDLQFEQENSEKHSLNEWKEKVCDELKRATSLRLRADVPVNSYLSGGIDSSVILKLIQKYHPENFESFSVRFSDQYFDETHYQSLINKETGVKNSFIEITPKMIGDVFKKVVYHSEQPVFRTAPAPLYHLSGLVNKKGYKVVLTGEGADEVAWGYGIFKETMLRYQLSKNPNDEKWLSQIHKLNESLPQYDKRYEIFLMEYYKKFLDVPDSPLFSHQIKMSNGRYILNFLNPEIKDLVTENDLCEEIEGLLPSSYDAWSPVQKAQYLEMKTLLPGYLLSSQGDRMAMAHSVEGRYPFLDHNVVETFASMPDEIKLNGMVEKYILKKAFEDMLPEEIIQRSKYPYRAPEAVSLFHSELEEEYLNEETNRRHGMFNWKVVERLKAKLKSGSYGTEFMNNAAFIIIGSTLIFLEMLRNNFRIEKKRFPEIEFQEINLG